MRNGPAIDLRESQESEAADRQMEADRIEKANELSDQEFAERMKSKWPGVMLWPGKKEQK